MASFDPFGETPGDPSGDTLARSVKTNSRWCWIGETPSKHLDALVACLEGKCLESEPMRGKPMRRERIESEDWEPIQIQLISTASLSKVRKVLLKTVSDVFVWEIDDDGIAGTLDEIARAQIRLGRRWHVAAGIVSPAERVCLLEAGIDQLVDHPHEWPSLAKDSRFFQSRPTENS